jgi:hypothetical protein
MKRYLAIALLTLAHPLFASEPPAEKAEEPQRVHADPRFKGKVIVVGPSSASFGEAPTGEAPKAQKLDPVYADDTVPKPLPAPAPKPLGK